VEGDRRGGYVEQADGSMLAEYVVAEREEAAERLAAEHRITRMSAIQAAGASFAGLFSTETGPQRARRIINVAKTLEKWIWEGDGE
jgi:hypothetical protein